MDATAHLVAGAAAGSRVRHPLLALLAGVGTHAALDVIPHYNYTGWRTASPILVLDVLVGMALAGLVAARSARPDCAVAGAAGGVLPAVERLLTGQYRDFLRRPPLSLPEFETVPAWGILTQLLVVGVALLVGMRGLPRRGGLRAGKSNIIGTLTSNLSAKVAWPSWTGALRRRAWCTRQRGCGNRGTDPEVLPAGAARAGPGRGALLRRAAGRLRGAVRRVRVGGGRSRPGSAGRQAGRPRR
ncbi:MAG: hypothetical protein QN120_09395 [Armatimonadota bacterium]|nr:hypothetical protein [Armatimonadota bacterium]